MLDTLENSFPAPSYLLWIMEDYLKDRSLSYETLEGQRMEITLEVAQGFIIRPDLWNVSYDSLLIFDIPEQSCRVDYYLDDVAALVAGRIVEHPPSRLGILMPRVSGWMTAHDLALEKAEIVILTRKRILTLRPISIGELNIEPKPAVK